MGIRIQIEDDDQSPVPAFSFDEIAFRPSLAHGGWDCAFTVNGIGTVENVRIPALNIANVVAAMIEASKVMYTRAGDLPTYDFHTTVNRGVN
jgi:hypothetical protein